MSLVVKSESEMPTLAASVQKEIWAVDAAQPVNDVRLMEEVVSRSLGRQRFAALLRGGLAALTLLLAGVGIYGVLSCKRPEGHQGRGDPSLRSGWH